MTHTWKCFALSKIDSERLLSNHFCTPVLLPDGSLVCCGDDLVVGSGVSTVLKVTMEGVERLPDMLYPRGDVSVVLYADEVYVFGGAALDVQTEFLTSTDDYGKRRKACRLTRNPRVGNAFRT